MLSVPIREATFHPTDKIFLCQLTFHTLISFCHSLIFPLFKIILKNGMNLNSGGISLVIFVVNLNGGVVRHFLFVVFKCHNILTVPSFTLGNSVTVVCVVIALHNEIPATAFALSEANILFKHFCEFKFKCFPDVPEFITFVRGDRKAPPHLQEWQTLPIRNLRRWLISTVIYKMNRIEQPET